MNTHNYKSAIIHLSDIECGEHNRACSSRFMSGYAKCAKCLTDDLKNILFDQYRFSPVDVGLIVSGDVANKGKEDEYDEAFGLISEICQQVGIPPSQVAVVPGNHDINWESCEAAFSAANGKVKANELPEKLKNFGSFLQRICKRDMVPEKVLPFEGFARLGVALVGFDSTYPCSFNKENNFGGIRYEAIAESGKTVLDDLLKKNDRLIPMAVFHHNLYPLKTNDESYLHDYTKISKWLCKAGFGVVLCGHEHKPTEIDNKYDGIDLSVTGSFGLDAETLPKSGASTNKYRIILLNPESESEILLRELDPPGVFNGNWKKDSVCESIPVRFRRPHLPKMEIAKLRSLINIKTSRPVAIRDKGFVVAMQIDCIIKEAARCINSVEYKLGKHSIYADNRESFFLADAFLSEIPEQLYPCIESTSGPFSLEPISIQQL